MFSMADYAAFASFVLAAFLTLDRAMQWRIKRQFVTIELYYLNEKVRDQEQVHQDAETVRAHHRIDLMEKDVRALPGYEQFHNINASFNELKREVAVGNTKLENISKAVADLKRDFEENYKRVQ